MTPPSLTGLALIDKPAGVTSFQALQKIKQQCRTKRVGHTGTLDKFATGLIVVLVGRMTKLNPILEGMDKEYEAEIRFGEETATLDPEGEVVRRAPLPSLESIRRALEGFRGSLDQIPPQYSAIHIDGKRAYQRVRQGEAVEMPRRRIEIKELEIRDLQAERLRIRVRCSKGTYIRALARDIGEAAESCAYLTALKRTAVGPYRLEEAVSPGDFDPGRHLCRDREIFEATDWIAVRDITADFLPLIRNGVPLRSENMTEPPASEGPLALFYGEQFLGVAEYRDDAFRYLFLNGENR